MLPRSARSCRSMQRFGEKRRLVDGRLVWSLDPRLFALAGTVSQEQAGGHPEGGTSLSQQRFDSLNAGWLRAPSAACGIGGSHGRL